MPWPLPEGWDEKQIEETILGKQRSIQESSLRVFSDFGPCTLSSSNILI
jgi:hypothetical protein